MSIKQLNRDDLLNRFASHTFTETVVESMTLVEFKDGGSAVIARSQKMDVDDAYQNIREQLVGKSGDVMYRLTTTQRDALTSPKEILIFNITEAAVDCYNGTVWKIVNDPALTFRPPKTVQTTDNTVTVIDSFPLASNQVYMVRIAVMADRDNFSDRASYVKIGTFYQPGSGAVLQGTITDVHTAESDSQYDATLAVSGTLVQATVKGRTGHTVNWKCSMQFMEQ